jgi:flavocytochrome c
VTGALPNKTSKGFTMDYDVVVVGSGAAGLCAGLSANEKGASVLVVESEGVVGGSSRLAGGQIMGAGSRVQRTAGFEDNPDDLFRHYMSLNQWTVEPAVVRRLCDESAPTIDWLADLGVPFYGQLFYSGDEAVPRDHVPETFGAGIIEVLETHCRSAGVDIALGKRVDRLLVDSGRVVGVAAGSDEVRAHTVVIATGGFGANPDLLKQHYGRTSPAGDWLWYIGADSSRGDAFGLAKQINAQIIGHNRGLLLLAPDFGPGLDVYLPGWLVVVNQRGHRFFDEMSPYSTTETAIRAQDGPVYAIFDDAAKHAAQRSNAAAAKRQQFPGVTDLVEFKWIEPLIDEMVEKGVVHQAEFIETLAKQIDVPAPNLMGTVERYNEDIAAGRDSFYNKRIEFATPIASPPFYATELRLALLCLTSTGLRIDAGAHVIDERSQIVPGLFAAGECTGGVLGDIYVGSGNSYANCVVFGRVAGRAAADESLAHKAIID